MCAVNADADADANRDTDRDAHHDGHCNTHQQPDDNWIAANAFYYDDDRRYMRFLIPEGLRVLEIGCATGRLLADLKPSYGVGIDLSPEMVAVARAKHPHLHFVVGDAEDPAALRGLGGPFDVIVLSDTIGLLEDCESTLRHLHLLCTRETRVVLAYYNRLWGPILRLAEAAGAKMPSQPGHNWLSSNDIQGLLYLAGLRAHQARVEAVDPQAPHGARSTCQSVPGHSSGDTAGVSAPLYRGASDAQRGPGPALDDRRRALSQRARKHRSGGSPYATILRGPGDALRGRPQ